MLPSGRSYFGRISKPPEHSGAPELADIGVIRLPDDVEMILDHSSFVIFEPEISEGVQDGQMSLQLDIHLVTECVIVLLADEVCQDQLAT